MDAVDRMKHEVAKAAADSVESGMVVGLGSGSTAAIVIELIGKRRDLDIVGVPTSFQATQLAIEHGIRLVSLNEVERIDLAIDGADEVDPQLNLIKGGGGCHTREKLVDARADSLTIVVDSTKLVDRLGSTMPLPVEVLPEAYAQVMRAVEELGGQPALRMAVRKAGPVVTDQGNLLIDVTFDGIHAPADLEKDLNNIPGVLDNGLFVGLADRVLVGEILDGEVRVRELA